MHEIYNGGYLNVHTDFNIHPKNNWHRKLNIIFYLNPNWSDEWEGHLELWNEAVDTMITRIAPIENRLAIFETSEISFHGHPTPLNTPDNITRRSLATYYYTNWPAGLEPRLKTNYRLVPWQVKEVQGSIKKLRSQGLSDEKIIETLKLQYQEADLKRQLRDSYK